ncbi:glycosyltransferase family 2 protein [Opitutales bacterium]|nr:glycosyltransferase family 2 protein [Opitutales bacterium]
MKLSIVTTLYNSEEYVLDFYDRASHAAQNLAGNDYEIIFVNDGSPDSSLDKAIHLTHEHNNIKIIDLSRNFGHHKAMMTGLEHSSGYHVFLIDSDLEEKPEWLSSFNEQMTKDNADMVYGIQDHRKGAFIEKVTGALFYKVFRLLTGVAQPNNIVTARLMSRRYVNALISHKESELNIGGLWIITGFIQSTQVVQKSSSSETTYNFARKLSHLVNAITSFSSLPLVYTFYTGLLLSLSAFIFIIKLLIQFFFMVKPPDGYTSMIASIWFFSGLVILFLGIQGIYLSKMFIETKNRPYTIIRKIYK